MTSEAGNLGVQSNGAFEDEEKCIETPASRSSLCLESPQDPSSTVNHDGLTKGAGPEIIDWNGDSDPDNPYNWSEAYKWFVIGTALLGSLIIPLNGTSITVAAVEINEMFGISDVSFPNSFWPVTSWGLGGAVFVIVGLPLMEDVGVRVGYLCFYAFFIIMIIPQAVAQNFATLIVTRFFSGGSVTLLANILSSMIPDMWADDKGRTIPVTFWILAYLEGSTLGPPIFAGVMQHIGNWRWIFYIQLIMYGVFFPIFFFVIPETRKDIILGRRAKKLRRETGRQIYTQSELSQRSVLRGLATASARPIYLLFTEPVLIATTLWSSFCFGLVYLFTQSVGQVFQGIYGWKEYSAGYVQAAVAIGELLGWGVTVYGSRIYLQSTSRNTEMPGHPIPEARLYASIPSSFIGLAGGMFVYAWTSYASVPWIAPAIGLAMVGFGVQIVVTAIADYIEDAYAVSGFAGSAISSVAACENIVSALLPLAAQSMYRTLGFQWASSVLAFIALLLSCAPVVLIWKGQYFREKSPFMLSGGESGKAWTGAH